jgi:sugar lactone lactonase YvrE
MKRILYVIVPFAALVVYLYVPRPDKKHLVMAEAYEIGPSPAAVEAVRSKDDFVRSSLRHDPSDLPGFDDFILYEKEGFALATGTDGFIWKVDLATAKSERFADVPLVASGAVRVPGDPDRIYACVSRLYGEKHDPSERVGVYEIRISTREVRPVITEVMIPPPVQAGPQPGIVYADGQAPSLRRRDFTPENSRPMAFCNDLAVSSDGKRIYMTTPYAYEGAAMGGGAFGEAITLARNGLLWRYDLASETIELAARDFNFIDGILLEDKDGREESVLITETTKFRIDRLYLRGQKAGTHDVLYEFLPGMPDGMDRDHQGRIWIGVIKKRTGFITWAHKNPWIKFALLNLPQSILPVPGQTGLLVLSPDASRPLFYTEHDGSGPGEIAVAVPGRDRVYLPNFRKSSRGVYSIPYPEALQPGDTK